MLKRVTLTQHGTIERWESWIVSVPDDMEGDRIEELMRDLWETGELELEELEENDEGDPSVVISEAPANATAPDLTLTDGGLVDDDMLTAFPTDRLQTELERRRAKDSDAIVV